MHHPYGYPEHSRARAPALASMPVTASVIPSASASKLDVAQVPRPVARREIIVGPLPGHYLKHEGKIALFLAGQDENASNPVYGRHSIIQGTLCVSDPANVLAVEVKMEGAIKIKEISEGGSVDTQLFTEHLVKWDHESDGPAPALFPFNRGIPTHYHDELGNHCSIPPTYHARLNGIPGFKVYVEYSISVTVSRRVPLWKRSTRRDSHFCVPFIYRPRTRPSMVGPFPKKDHASASSPQTLFISPLQSRRIELEPVMVLLYLPRSRTLSLREAVPFEVTLLGNRRSLAPFIYVPSADASFHPLSTSNRQNGSVEPLAAFKAWRQQFSRSSIDLSSIISVRVERYTYVDSQPLGILRSCNKGWVSKSVLLGEGVIQEIDANANSVSCSGRITVPPDICGAFMTSHLGVKDVIVLAIAPPTGQDGRPFFSPFRLTIDIRLTTDIYSCCSALKVSNLHGSEKLPFSP